MIYPYAMYEKEIKERFQEELYNPDLKFFFDKGYRSLPNTTKSNGRYYAATDDDGGLLGYMFYYYDGSMITDFHIVWFDQKDLYEWKKHGKFLAPNYIVESAMSIIRGAIVNFGITDIFLSAVAGGPVYNVYDNIIDHYKGEIAGVCHNRIRLEDGKLYNKIYFEIHLSKNS